MTGGRHPQVYAPRQAITNAVVAHRAKVIDVPSGLELKKWVRWCGARAGRNLEIGATSDFTSNLHLTYPFCMRTIAFRKRAKIMDVEHSTKLRIIISARTRVNKFHSYKRGIYNN